MTKAERMLLSDAIEAAILAEKRVIKWRRLFYMACAASGVLLVLVLL